MYTVRREFPGAWKFPRSTVGRIGLLALIIAGIMLRTGGLDWGLSHEIPYNPPYHDEPHVMSFLTAPWERFVEDFGEYEIARPVYFWRAATKPVFVLGERFGWNTPKNHVFEFAVPRAVNSLFGILGLVAIYFLGAKLGGVRAGIFSLALLAVMPGHWYYSQILKGDLLVATYNTLLLLASIFIFERGSRFWYVVAGLAAGVGIASKPSVAVIFPVVALAHIARAIRLKDLRPLLGRNAIVALLVATVSFAFFYPYPFLDFDRLQKLLTEPKTQFFSVNVQPTPTSFLASWRAYNEPPKLFMEMVFGEALRRFFPLGAALFVLITMLALRAQRGVPYLLTLLGAFLVFHSLSFTGPLDDRYVVPLSPFVALFPAVLTSLAVPLTRAPRILSWLGSGITSLLFLYTAGVTLAIFPTFALGKDVRLQVTEFLEATAKPGELIGEFEPGGRQSLPFDRNKAQVVGLRTHGEDPHVFLSATPDYVVYPVEPWNYDHSFRYQLHTPEIREEFFQQFLKSYTLLRTFGHEPVAFGRRLPRLLATPVYEIYKRTEGPAVESVPLADADWRSGVTTRPVDVSAPVPLTDPTVVVSGRSWKLSDLTDRLFVATLDLSELQRLWEVGKPASGTIALILLLDGSRLAGTPPNRVSEPDFTGDEGTIVHLLPLEQSALRGAANITLAALFRENGLIEVSSGVNGRRIGRGILKHPEAKTVQFGVGVIPRESSVAELRILNLALAHKRVTRREDGPAEEDREGPRPQEKL